MADGDQAPKYPWSFWAKVLGEDEDEPKHALLVGTMVDAAAGLDREVLDEAIRTIDLGESVGPILDPSAWHRPRAFDRARLTRGVLVALRDLGDAERKRREDWG